MDFGVVLQTDPPAWRVVELARQAETLGFSHGWTFDSHVLWQEPYVVYSQMLSATIRLVADSTRALTLICLLSPTRVIVCSSSTRSSLI